MLQIYATKALGILSGKCICDGCNRSRSVEMHPRSRGKGDDGFTWKMPAGWVKIPAKEGVEETHYCTICREQGKGKKS